MLTQSCLSSVRQDRLVVNRRRLVVVATGQDVTGHEAETPTDQWAPSFADAAQKRAVLNVGTREMAEAFSTPLAGGWQLHAERFDRSLMASKTAPSRSLYALTAAAGRTIG